MENRKLIIGGIIGVLTVIFFLFANPFSYNDEGERTVVTQSTGHQFVQFTPGAYYSGFFAKTVEWPNQISVLYQDTVPNFNMIDGSIDIGRITVRYNDATTADLSGITQYILPADEKEMIDMHNAHRTPQSLVSKRLAPYTKECLQSAAQLMSSEMHYGGGRAQMAQDFSDQLKNGVYLLITNEKMVYDSVEKEKKRVYETIMQKDKLGNAKHKTSSIKEYGITISDAAITDVDYELKVDQMLAKKIDAATKASIAKQDLMTAQQQALTEEAKGKKKLVETEYLEKVTQTQQVVQAQTKVQLAEQDRQQQEIALRASRLEAEKRKTLADAEAYEKRTVMQANGALETKIEAWVTVNVEYAKALSNSNWCPTTIIGGGSGTGTPWANGNPAALIDMLTTKTAKELNLNTSTK